jgi:hypothetical protein
MQNYIKIYLKYFDLGDQDVIQCECCMRSGRLDNGGFDIHHIEGRGEGKDVIKNLMCLCRSCHTKVHEKNLFNKGDLQYIHNCYISGKRKSFIK